MSLDEVERSMSSLELSNDSSFISDHNDVDEGGDGSDPEEEVGIDESVSDLDDSLRTLSTDAGSTASSRSFCRGGGARPLLPRNDGNGNPILPRRSCLKTQESSNETVTSASSGGSQVSFDTVTIRRYDMDLGNHPSCSIGAPVTLSWEFEEEDSVDVDIYECERKPRRKIQHLLLNYYRRQDILRKAGYSEKDLKDAERRVAKARRQRGRTSMLVPVQRMEELVQSASRKVKRVVHNSGNSKKEDPPATATARGTCI